MLFRDSNFKRKKVVKTRRHPKVYTKNYRRPKTPKSFFSFKKIIIFLFLIILFSGLVYFIFLSGIFQVKNIILINNRSVILEEVEKTLDPIYKKKLLNLEFNNILFFKSQEAKSLLLKKYPRLSSIEIKRKFPDTLEIKVQEREGVIVWDIGDKRYLIDEEGVAFSECLGESNLPKVVDSKKLPIDLNSQIINSDFINFVLQLLEKLPKENIAINSVTISESIYDIEIGTQKGYKIYFDIRRSLDSQINKLRTLLEKIGGEVNYIQYIDLRIENKVFYR